MALTWLRPKGADVNSEATLIRTAIEKEMELKSTVGIWDMFRDPVNRRRTILAVSAVTLQAGSGSMFIIGIISLSARSSHCLGSFVMLTNMSRHKAYKAYFFAMAHVSNPFGMSCILSTMGLVAILINSSIVVRYGRRRVLLLSGLIFCGILQLIIAVVYDKQPGTKTTGKVIVALVCLYMMSYNVRPFFRPSPFPALAYGISNTFTGRLGNDSILRLVVGWRTPHPTPTKPHVRSRGRHRLPGCLAHHLHRAVLYQPGLVGLGSTVRVHLVPFVRRGRRLGILFLARSQRENVGRN